MSQDFHTSRILLSCQLLASLALQGRGHLSDLTLYYHRLTE